MHRWTIFLFSSIRLGVGKQSCGKRWQNKGFRAFINGVVKGSGIGKILVRFWVNLEWSLINKKWIWTILGRIRRNERNSLNFEKSK